MKIVKSLALGIMIISSSATFGQKTAEEKATAQTERMKTELGLSQEQVTKVKTINLGIIQKNENTLNNASMSDIQKKEIIKSNNESRKSMLKDVLTSEQYTKMETIIAERQINKMKAQKKAQGKVKELKKD